MSRKIIDLTGKKFGKLTVIKFAGMKKSPSGRSRAMWLCHCKCGREEILRGCGLVRISKSCSGFHRYKLRKGEANFNDVYNRYQRRAKNKNLVWSLTKKQLKNLTKGNCHYCGLKPNQHRRTRNTYGDYLYNGIDRKDNSKGYTSNNCVACCDICNRAKWTHSYKEFKAWIKRFVSYQLSKRKAS